MAKIIDRFLLFVFSLAAIVAVCFLLLSAFAIVPYDWTTRFWRDVYFEIDTAVVFITVCIVVLLIGIRLFYISVRTGQAQAPSIDQRSDYGDIRISMETVENLALRAASRTRGVKDLRARVRVSGAGLEITIRTIVDGEASIPAITEEMQSAVKSHVEEITGIPVASVSVFIANVSQTTPTFKSRVE